MTAEYDLNFPYAWGEPLVSARFRVYPEDFQVDEDLGITPSGQGEHWLLQVQKRGQNTAWVADQIARLANVPVRDIGYCGLKDRHAVTSQWFSVYLPKGPVPDWNTLSTEDVTLLQATRHDRKLRRGQHRTNRFVLRLRDITGVSPEQLEDRIAQVLSQGVPNYFGEQRFGRGGGNLPRAQELLVDGKPIRQRQLRGLVLSAARSWLFNQVLAGRVAQGNWRELLPGDPQPEPSGPLWGRGRSQASATTLELESTLLEPWQSWCAGLEHVGLNQERRALHLLPENASWRWLEGDLELSFSLPPGTFATAVLRELANLTAGAADNAIEDA